MELRQLNYFIAISDAKSFTRAAEKLYVSQPALTGQINALENELGMKLFDRTNKFVQLTPAGEVFSDCSSFHSANSSICTASFR